MTDGKFRDLGYGYDANGRTVRVSEANRPDAVSVYDALGNRVAEKVNDVWQFVIYDAVSKIVAEYGGTGATATSDLGLAVVDPRLESRQRRPTT